MHSCINQIDLKNLSSTKQEGSKPIDAIATVEGVAEHIDGCKLLAHADITLSYHRSCLIDVNLKEYFNESFSS